jgi:uncharacterized protein (TIGR04141 family)
MFEATDYQKAFPWVNYIYEVTNKTRIEQLNEELIKRIKSGEMARLFLAVPEIVEWTDIEGFKFSKRDDEEVHPDIFLSDFLKTIRDVERISVDFLKQRQVFQVRADTGVAEPKWSVFHCLNLEIDRDRKIYILTEGTWYEVEASFVNRVNDRMKDVAKFSIRLPARKDEKEVDYCRRLSESDEILYALMDRKTIRYGGGPSQIEFCDLFTKDRKLIHIKRYSSASVLSHLFTQGTNCAWAFLADVEFRREVNRKLPASHQLDPEKPPVSKDYEIVYGIISETADALPDKLPFFSKITLMRSFKELQVMGFKVSISGIQVKA